MKRIVYILAFALLAPTLWADNDTTDLNLLVLKGARKKVFAHNQDPFLFANSNDRLRTQEGIYLKEGNGRMLSSLRVNGTSPAQTVALWHGLNLNNALNGQVDANLLPSHLFNFTFVNTGSSVSGNSAMAGALLMENNAVDSQLVVQLSGGSFGQWNQTILKGFGIKNGNLFIGVQNHQSKNNYNYQLGNRTAELNNAEAKILHGVVGLDKNLGTNWKLNSNFWFTNANRQIPANILAAPGKEFQQDESWRGQMELSQQKGKRELSFNQSLSIDNLRFVDADASLNSFYKSFQGNWELNYEYHFNPRNHLKVSGFHQHQKALNFFEGNPELYQTGSKASWLNQGINGYLAANASIQRFNQGFTPINYEIVMSHKWKGWNAKFIHNTSFRAPTLNDLYWPVSGNQDLMPEEGFKVQGVLNKKLLCKNKRDWCYAELGLQVAEYQNQIIWFPGNFLNLWSPINIKQTYHTNSHLKVKGFKQIGQFKINILSNLQFLMANENGLFERGNQLTYAPELIWNNSVQMELNKHHVMITHSGQSESFTSTDNSSFVEGFNLLNLRYNYKGKLRHKTFSPFISIQNLTNQQYAFTLNRPMPGINFELGFNLTI